MLNGRLHITFEDRGDFCEANRFHENLIGLQEYGGHGRLKQGIVAEHQSPGVGLRVAHRVDDGKPIAGIRHVQIGQQDIEYFRGNEFQGFTNGVGGRHVEAVAFQALAPH